MASTSWSISTVLRGQRLGILARRPAPIQASHLSYNGTGGHTFTDYLIADPVSVPMDLQEFYTEDRPSAGLLSSVEWHTETVEPIPSRRDYGLPVDGSSSAASASVTRSRRRCSTSG